MKIMENVTEDETTVCNSDDRETENESEKKVDGGCKNEESENERDSDNEKTTCEEAAEEGQWEVAIQHLNDVVCPAEVFSCFAQGGSVNLHKIISYVLAAYAKSEQWGLFENLAAICPDPDEVLGCLLESPSAWRRWSSVEKLVDRCTDPRTASLVLDFAVFWCRLEIAKHMIDKVDVKHFPLACVLKVLKRFRRINSDLHMEMLCLFVSAGCSTVDRAAVQGTEEDPAGPVAGDAEMQASTSAELPDVYDALSEASDDDALSEASDDDALSEGSDKQEVFESLLLPHSENPSSTLQNELMVVVTHLMIGSGALTHRQLDALRHNPSLQQRLETEMDEHWQQSCTAVLEAAATPSSLQHLARLAVVRAVGLGPGRLARVDELPIPNPLKDMVRFKDVTKDVEDKISVQRAGQQQKSCCDCQSCRDAIPFCPCGACW